LANDRLVKVSASLRPVPATPKAHSYQAISGLYNSGGRTFPPYAQNPASPFACKGKRKNRLCKIGQKSGSRENSEIAQKHLLQMSCAYAQEMSNFPKIWYLNI
jgi:hypothetical protein